MKLENAELRDRLAAEYALGTLRGHARRRFERLMAGDPALARLAEDWALRLDPLAAAASKVEPPAAVWRGIERRLGPSPQRQQATDRSGLSRRRTLQERLFGRPAESVPSLATAGLWYCVGFWRGLGLSAAALALALLIYVLAGPVGGPHATYVALLADAANKPVVVANLDLTEGRLTLDAARLPAPEAGKSLELWILPPAGPPRSLGVMPSGTVRLALDARAMADLAHGGLAVSLEPASGSPTGLPTGPVLYSGAVLPTS
ncbi:MAG: anti-sigma factor [Pseudomonadota bacterium]